jgi:hypothetical protein
LVHVEAVQEQQEMRQDVDDKEVTAFEAAADGG